MTGPLLRFTRPATVRARVAIGTFVLLALVLVVTGVVVEELVRETSMKSLDGRLMAEAEALATLTHYEENGRLELEFEDETMTAYVSSRSGAYFQVWTRKGLLEHSRSLGTARLPAPEREMFDPLEGAGARRSNHRNVAGPRGTLVRLQQLAVPRTAGTEGSEAPPGTPRITIVVQVARELTAVEHVRRQARVALAIALPLALLLGTAGSFVVAARATAPVARLGAEASAIGRGSLERRLDLTRVDGELLALAQNLNEAFDRLAGAVERERRFASDVAHELRTPLAVGRSSLELALLNERSPEEYRAAIRSALDASRRLEQLVGSLLLLGRAEARAEGRPDGRAEAGRAETGRRPPERVDLRGATAAAVQGLDALAVESRTPLLPRLGESPIFVRGDAVLLDRLVANLVENALRHGGATREGVEVVLSAAGETVTLSVLDRGPGFPAELLARPFERFARGDRSRNRATGGAGLGLAIVRAIARAHGGDAHLENREGGGASVRVSLPVAPPGDEAPQGA